ncbi:MAG: DUF5009 domain-containing protein [Gemmatimonadaceae bacterium]
MSPEEPIVIHPAVHGEVHDVGVPEPAPTDPARDRAPVRPRAAELAAVAEAVAAAAPSDVIATDAPKRAFSLDALRGLFLIAMTFGFTIWGTELPLWMYHRQMPPPDLAIVPLAGLAWRDLAYGAFLFTMAAAFPLTLSRRIAMAETELGIVFSAIRRYLLLLFYAVLIGHSNNFFMGYSQTTRALAIVGFGIMALIFTRRRADWDPARFRLLNRAGWVLGLAYLAFSPLLYGETFSFTRMDDVISGLAFAALFGSVTWYFTRDNLVARVGILAAVVALHLGAQDDGWLQQWWHSSPLPWAFLPSRLFLLTIVIPGTIAGDVVLRWMQSADTGAVSTWNGGRLALLAALATAFTPLIVVGTYNREVQLTTQLCLAMIIAGLFVTARPIAPTERMLRSLFMWGAVWLTLGLFMEPFQGGIKKVPETLSYFFVVAGITTMLLVALTALVDGLNRRRWVSALIDVGHNPLMAYVLFSILMNSALEMIPPLRGVLRNSAGEVVLRSIVEVTATVLIVRHFSRKRIYWRT